MWDAGGKELFLESFVYAMFAGPNKVLAMAYITRHCLAELGGNLAVSHFKAIQSISNKDIV